MTTVRYRNWWNEFDPRLSFIPRLLGMALPDTVMDVVTRSGSLVDIEVHSAVSRAGALNAAGIKLRSRLQRRSPGIADQLRQTYGVGFRGPARNHIWYTGENLRPPSGWTATLSFDLDSYEGTNWYLPFWAINTSDLGGSDPADAFTPTCGDLVLPRLPPLRIPPRFACVLARNAHPLRMRVAEALGRLGQVDLYGSAFGGPAVPSKMELMKEYRFAVVLENDLYPGYVTEKAPEAWMSGTVPLWWGNDPAGYLNPRALVNLADSDLATFLEEVDQLNRDEGLWAERYCQPILNRTYDYESLIEWLRSRIGVT